MWGALSTAPLIDRQSPPELGITDPEALPESQACPIPHPASAWFADAGRHRRERSSHKRWQWKRLWSTPRSIVVRVTGDCGDRSLWFRSEEMAWQEPPSTVDFVAIALAHLAASCGSDLTIDGPVTAAQLERLD